MQKNKRRTCIILCIILIALAAGCSEKIEKVPYNKETAVSALDGVVVAENSSYRLEWDKKTNNIILYDKINRKTWATTPTKSEKKLDDLNKKTHAMVCSAITVDYIIPKTLKIASVNAANGAVKNGRVSSERIENGLRVTYYFDKQEIVVPVEYILNKDSLIVSIDSSKIEEHENKVYKIGIAPFLCSVENDENNSYLFVPSGCGALMYPDTGRNMVREYSEEVYGDDRTRKVMEKISNTESIRLPVFGVKDKDSALLAILEKGAESVEIKAQAGNDKYGYSSVYATLFVRGSETVEKKVTTVRQKVTLYTEDKSNSSLIKIGFYPLGKADADYVGMAKRYSRYLTEKSDMPSKSKDSLLNIKFLGGIMIRKFCFGIPYKCLQPMTTITQVNNILKDIEKETNQKPVIDLVGFGETGLDIGKIADYNKLGDGLGSHKELQKLIEYGKQKDIPIYMDYDVVRLAKSGNGFSAVFDTAKAANRQTAYQYNYSLAFRTIDKNMQRYKLLSRKALSGVAEQLIGGAEQTGITGMGLGTLSSIAYSDYDDNKYFVKAGMADDVSSILKSIKGQGIGFIVNHANVYAASIADHIIDAPMQASCYDALDAEIPFYQIVFKGHVPIAGTPVNLSVNSEIAVLKAVESGCGLTFTLINDYDALLLSNSNVKLYSSLYKDNKKLIKTLTNELNNYYKSINGAKISEHLIFENGVRKTVFDNGITVFVNYSNKEQHTEVGLVPPLGYRVKGVII